MKKKTLIIAVAAIVLAVVSACSVTLAWLTAQTNPVTNTFSVGNITIELTESANEYKVIPGGKDAKDPKVTVKKDSEKCYVYVLVENNLVLDNGTKVGVHNINNIDDNPTQDWRIVHESGNKTLYCYKIVVDANDADVVLPIFTQVKYDGEQITSDNIAQLTDKKIVIDAFAHQSENIADTDDAAKSFADAKAKEHFELNN